MTTASTTLPGGTWNLGDRTVTRFGYGAMQLAGPWVMGPPADHDGAIAVLREAVAQGVTHIDTSDYYGPFIVNEILREALHPYPADLRIVTKVGCRRGEDGSWNLDTSPDELVREVHENLERLDLEAIDVVNLRVSDDHSESLAEAFGTLAELREKGLIRHLGVSNVSPEQLEEARGVAPVVCVQNHYNLVHRADDALVDHCAAEGIAYTSFFPLGGFSPLQSDTLARVAQRLGRLAGFQDGDGLHAPDLSTRAYRRHTSALPPGSPSASTTAAFAGSRQSLRQSSPTRVIRSSE